MGPVVKYEIRRRKLSSGNVIGTVERPGGLLLKAPVVVVGEDGVPYAWALGHAGRYALELPAGRYELYATGEGYSESASVAVSLRANETVSAGFCRSAAARVDCKCRSRTRPPERLVDARLDIKTGQKPVVEYLGKHVFFTDLQPKGRAEITLAPGPYVLSVGSGAGFLSKALDVPVTVVSGQAQPLAVAVDRLFNPQKAGWYSADMHHHSDQEDGVTPPADLARSELAAGLDLLFVSDHDTTANHEVLQKIADERGVPFIPSIELSPSWGHFNAYPIKLGAPMTLEMSKATVQEVFAEAHRMGAEFIEVNHPYNPGEGYFASLDRGVATGGFDPDFNFLEINGSEPDHDDKSLAAAWKFWGQGKRYYLAAGSDTHDVWNGDPAMRVSMCTRRWTVDGGELPRRPAARPRLCQPRTIGFRRSDVRCIGNIERWRCPFNLPDGSRRGAEASDGEVPGTDGEDRELHCRHDGLALDLLRDGSRILSGNCDRRRWQYRLFRSDMGGSTALRFSKAAFWNNRRIPHRPIQTDSYIAGLPLG